MWIAASACTGTTTTIPNCKEQVGATYCTLCNNGYIAFRASATSSTCVARYTNMIYIDPVVLGHCLMTNATHRCLMCDLFKNVTARQCDHCNVPLAANIHIVGRATYLNSLATNIIRYQISGHSSPYMIPDVLIGMGATKPTAMQGTMYGNNIYVDQTAKHLSNESYSLASDKPYIVASTGETGMIYVYTFGYGMIVPQSFSAYRTPCHTFGAGVIIAVGTNDCPNNTSTGVKCSAASSNADVCTGKGYCTCSATTAGLACEETITETYTSGFSFSKKTATMGKIIVKTTATDMKRFGYTDILASIPDNMNKAGGQSIQALVRSASINGRYRKDKFTVGAWTGNTYLPGFQNDYWNKSKTLGKERRILTRIFSKNDYKMTFGQDQESFEVMVATDPIIYTTMVNLNSVEMSLSAEVLERGMPLALKILIPVFVVLSIAVGILVGWCLMDTSEKEEEEGSETAKESHNEDKAGLNAEKKEQTYQIPQDKNEKSNIKAEKYVGQENAQVKKENLSMTNQGNTQAQPEVEPVPTIPHTIQQQEEPVMQSNLIDDSPGNLQDDEAGLEEIHDLDEDKRIETQNIQLGQKGSMSNADEEPERQNQNLASNDGELNFDPVDGELDSVE